MKTSYSRCRQARPRAFTLIELLTVIAVIGILAAILIPVAGKMRSSANRATCSSNLRRIGVATLMYVQDNKNSMPYPHWGGVSATATIDQYGFKSLAGHLLPYMYPGRPTVSTAWQKVPEFACPAWLRLSDNSNPEANATSMVFLLNIQEQKPGGNGTTINYFDVFDQWTTAGKSKAKYRYSEIPNPTRMLMLKDADKLLDSRSIAVTPLHGAVRNHLFMDGHVEVAPVN